jgi:hypothetical protein
MQLQTRGVLILLLFTGIGVSVGALAHFGLARACALNAQTSYGANVAAAPASARKTNEYFLALRRYAGPDIPILEEAQRE